MPIRLLGFVLVLGAVMVLFSAFSPHFATTANFSAILRHMSAIELSALGLTCVVVVRKSDLAFPGIASLGAMTAAWLIAQQQGLPLALLAGIAIGIVCGAISGAAVGFMRLPDIVSTIAIGAISASLSFLYSQGATISDNFVSAGLVDINSRSIAFVGVPVLLMLAMNLAAWVILHRTRFGRAFYATGENPRSAFFSGVRTRSYLLGAFVISGGMSCLAGILRSAEAGQADVHIGSGLLLPAYASVYLGAALFGRTSVLATFASCMLISATLDGCTLLGVPYYYGEGIMSLIVLMAVIAFDPRTAGLLSTAILHSGKKTEP
jgi:ribose transport system permease protein